MSKLLINKQMPIMIEDSSTLWGDSYTSYGRFTTKMNSPIPLIECDQRVVYFNPVHMPYNGSSIPYVPNIRDSSGNCFSTSKSNSSARDYEVYSKYKYSGYIINQKYTVSQDSNRKTFYYKIGATTSDYYDSLTRYYQAGDTTKDIIGITVNGLGDLQVAGEDYSDGYKWFHIQFGGNNSSYYSLSFQLKSYGGSVQRINYFDGGFSAVAPSGSAADGLFLNFQFQVGKTYTNCRDIRLLFYLDSSGNLKVRGVYSASYFNVTYGTNLYADNNTNVSISETGWTSLAINSAAVNTLRGLFSQALYFDQTYYENQYGDNASGYLGVWSKT